MKTLFVDVAVIGAGTAGMTAYRAAQTHGKHVVLIDGGKYGTTCARVGCMPSKLLIAAAEAAHSPSLAPAFGIDTSVVGINGKSVMARVQAERDRFVGFVIEGVEQIQEENRLRGYAQFAAPNRLQIDDHTVVEAGSIVIATGSRPAIPELFQHLGKHLVTSDDIFEWTDLPESVAVIGTGVIGLELGQALYRLGVRVTLFGRAGGLAQLTDEAVLGKAVQYLGSEMDLRLQTEILSATVNDDAVLLRSKDAGGVERTEYFKYVLAATGRTSNVGQLALENSGLQLDKRGIPLYDTMTMQCGQSTGIHCRRRRQRASGPA